MSWVAVAVAGGAVAGSLIQSQGAKSAAGTQSRAGERSIDLQRDIYNTSRSDLSPYREAGLAALTRLQKLMGIGPEGKSSASDAEVGSLDRNFTSADLNADPVYQSGLEFGLNEGTKGINARALASGGYDSGATLKALSRYATDYGSTKGAEAYNRFVTNQGTKYSRLSGIAGSGQNAANMTGTLGSAYSTSAGGTITGIGNANAASQIAQANAFTGGINNATNYYGQSRLLDQLSPGGQRNAGGDTSYIEMPR